MYDIFNVGIFPCMNIPVQIWFVIIRILTTSLHTCKIELHLEADVYVRSVDRGGPPQSESAVRNLIQTGALGISQLLVLHAFLNVRIYTI